jgi:hypothetical protein
MDLASLSHSTIMPLMEATSTNRDRGADLLPGCTGSIVGIYQVWRMTPAVRKPGDTSGDLEIWLGTAVSGVTFPALRYQTAEEDYVAKKLEGTSVAQGT